MPEWLLGALSSRQLLTGGLLIVAAVVVVGARSGWMAAAGLLALLLALGAFYLWTRVQKIRTELIRQLPGFLDIIARLIVVGNSTQAAFQMAIPGVQNPLRQQMDNALSLVRAGLDIDQALQQVANKVRFEEMQLLASIMGLWVRYGGRSDVLLERGGGPASPGWGARPSPPSGALFPPASGTTAPGASWCWARPACRRWASTCSTACPGWSDPHDGPHPPAAVPGLAEPGPGAHGRAAAAPPAAAAARRPGDPERAGPQRCRPAPRDRKSVV